MADELLVAATENAAPAAVIESPAKVESVSAAAENSPAATGEASKEVVAEPEWAPDYKFKVRDNVHEFDDVIKPLVNKDNHPKIKELYEKAFGLDYAKKRLTDYDEQFKGLNEKSKKLESFETLSQQLDTMLDKGDFTSFQKTLQISDEMVMKRAMDILKTKEMSPAERQDWENRQASQAQFYNLEQQNQAYQKQLMSHSISQRQSQLDSILGSPELQSVVNDFDARAGKPGAFKERVWAHGATTYNTQKIDLSPEEAVRGFLDFANIKLGTVANANAQAQVASPATLASPKETLPNISSSGKSPAKKVFSSIDELRKAAANLPTG